MAILKRRPQPASTQRAQRLMLLVIALAGSSCAPTRTDCRHAARADESSHDAARFAELVFGAARNDEAVLRNAMLLYYRDNGTWPRSAADLSPFLADAGRYQNATIATLSDGHVTVTFAPRPSTKPTVAEIFADSASRNFTVSPPEPPTTAPAADHRPTTRSTKDLGLYEGFDADAAVLRDVYEIKNPDRVMRGSSGKAQEAARRVFGRVVFLHRSRAEVLDMLGDPQTLSDYGRAAGKGKDDPLVYVFDSGFGGCVYTLGFRRDRCVSVMVESLD